MIANKRYADTSYGTLLPGFGLKGDVSKSRMIRFRSQLDNNDLKLKEIEKLSNDWNSYGAPPITKEVISKARHFLSMLRFTPKVFPTGRNSIQIEKYVDDDNLIELEVAADSYGVYLVCQGAEEERENISEREAIELMNKYEHE